MATLKCLACGHDNKVGDEFCTSCSSSLNLKLCSACEAINANSAERCHSCGAQFRGQAEVVAPAQPHIVQVEEAEPSGQRLPAVWRLAAERITQRSSRRRAALWSLPLVAAAGLGSYYLYGMPEASPQDKEHKQVPAMAVKTAPAPLAQRQQAAAAPVASPRVLPVAVTPAPAAAVAPRAAVPAASQTKRVAVTHTRAAAVATGVAAAEAPTPSAAPQARPKDETPGCPPAVVALGLCRTQ